MNERNIQNRRRRKRTRQRWSACLVILILFIAVITIIVTICSSWKVKFLREITPKDPAADYSLTVALQNDTADYNIQDNAPQNAPTDVPYYLMLANKWNTIPENYEINLVNVKDGIRVDERIYEPLMDMLEAAKVGNWDQLPIVVSGYRTTEQQQNLYNEKIEKYKKEGYSAEEAKEMAEQWVVIPGTSEHQLGLAVDINGATYDVYLWLQKNSYKYGFIFRYPGSKTEITGVAEEVWHYRYVGVEAATEIYEQGICLEEYLDKTK